MWVLFMAASEKDRNSSVFDLEESLFFSIIIPAYNSGATIFDAIQSVINQTWTEFEVLICDDASTDNTVDVVRSFDDPRVKLFLNKINKGPGRSRDFLIQKSIGRWIAVLDADDVYEPTRLEVFYEVAQENPNAIIFDEIMECHDTEKGLIPWRVVRESKALIGCDSFVPLGKKISVVSWLKCERTLMQWVAPTELIKRYNITHPNVRFGEDLGFVLRLLSTAKASLWYIPQPLYFYRLSSGSLTESSGRFEALLKVLNDARGYDGLDMEACSALDKRIEMVERRLVYQSFFSAFVNCRIYDCFVQVMKNTWVISEFLRRVVERIPYHLHRKWNSGSKRKTT